MRRADDRLIRSWGGPQVGVPSKTPRRAGRMHWDNGLFDGLCATRSRGCEAHRGEESASGLWTPEHRISKVARAAV